MVGTFAAGTARTASPERRANKELLLEQSGLQQPPSKNVIATLNGNKWTTLKRHSSSKTVNKTVGNMSYGSTESTPLPYITRHRAHTNFNLSAA